MKHLFKTLLINLTLVSTLSACNGADTDSSVDPLSVAKVVPFNQDWQFKKVSNKELAIENPTWTNVNLPHTAQIEPLIVNDQWQGLAEYKKTFIAPKEWQNKTLLIRFEAAMNHAHIFLNDVKLGEHMGGYLPFTLDMSKVINIGVENTLTVKLNNQDNPDIGPKPLKRLDFNTYGGLYRDVNILVKNSLHITDEIMANKVASGGIFITTPVVAEKQSSVNIKTHIANTEASKAEFTIRQTLLSADNKEVATISETVSLDANTDKQFSQDLLVNNAKLWSPNSPNLYTVTTELIKNDAVLESQSNRIGIRSFEFNEDHELLINGKVTFLRGVNRHQEYPYVGYATSPQADYRDAVKIKSAGYDYVRLSHYPHSKAFMNAADELGLVLLDAILGWQYFANTPEFKEQVLRTCHDMIRRDRNHASVLAWECSLNESKMTKGFMKQLNNVVHQEDTTRLSAGWKPDFDIYLQARQHRMKKNHYHEPTQPYNVSEYGDWEYYAQNAGLNQDAWQDLKKEERTSRQLLNSGEKRLLQQAFNLQESHNDNLTYPAFADGYWVMFDYNRGYYHDLESSGIMSINRLPKYSYYFYQSQRDPNIVSDNYASGPMAFIANEWRETSSTNVTVFSNAQEIELYLNDTLVARNKASDDKYSTMLKYAPFKFSLEGFTPGTLTAKAYIDGKQVATHQVTTPGEFTQLSVSIDTSGVAPATGTKDVVFVHATFLDADNVTVPLNNEDVVFTTQGDIKVLAPSSSASEQGIASTLIEIGNSLNGASITATHASGVSQTYTF
ncbi:glycoside hydrolase family 2 TIM barrel-domain containing protein [Thalassotalea nanhaiensis]|uniref:Glycoside hydrolase family 2 TIM barrel-domain containing protein n=1 Tax=Thalassotalea nanhaiensis TaxID=3065648 RepID=A0ABY9TKB7_9GAMM|nr:glycoside hydrolase family 2 TIM barrel-domain containing protein [Colwelliaceae bacterium SQ345]